MAREINKSFLGWDLLFALISDARGMAGLAPDKPRHGQRH
jgi:hypothetical protein